VGEVTTAGIDLGGTKCLGVAVAAGAVVAEVRTPTPRSGDPGAVVETVVALVAELRVRCGDDRGGGAAGPRTVPASVGVGAPGLVDREGVLRFAPNLPGGTELDLGAALRRRLDVPVLVDNDATCAAWGESRAGAARAIEDAVVVTLGTGIGGGIVAGGRLVRGANGFGGEVGHMVVDPGGPLCPCGRQGCWERYASGSGLARLAREAVAAGRGEALLALAGGDPGAITGEMVTRAAAGGDAGAVEVMAELAWWLALGLANLASIFDPRMFVIGGGLVEAGATLLDPARRAFDDLLAGGRHRPPVAIVPALLGERAGAVGAALLADSRP